MAPQLYRNQPRLVSDGNAGQHIKLRAEIFDVGIGLTIKLTVPVAVSKSILFFFIKEDFGVVITLCGESHLEESLSLLRL